MTVSGTLAFQTGALYLVQVDPASASKANVSGTASLAGNVLASFAPGSYVANQYDILHSAGLGGSPSPASAPPICPQALPPISVTPAPMYS